MEELWGQLLSIFASVTFYTVQITHNLLTNQHNFIFAFTSFHVGVIQQNWLLLI